MPLICTGRNCRCTFCPHVMTSSLCNSGCRPSRLSTSRVDATWESVKGQTAIWSSITITDIRYRVSTLYCMTLIIFTKYFNAQQLLHFAHRMYLCRTFLCKGEVVYSASDMERIIKYSNEIRTLNACFIYRRTIIKCQRLINTIYNAQTLSKSVAKAFETFRFCIILSAVCHNLRNNIKRTNRFSLNQIIRSNSMTKSS